MGEILGATCAMLLFGSLAAWAIRKITKMATVPSYVIGVAVMTLIGAWAYSANSQYSVAGAWVLYAIGGIIALAIMIATERHRRRKSTI